MRAGVIRNPRAHLHRRGRALPQEAGVPVAEPGSPEALQALLTSWAAAGVSRLVVDGGDGTVREVLQALPAAYGGAQAPTLAVLPSGKTNALALDLGAPRGWTVAAALAAASTVERAPVEVSDVGAEAPVRRGFLFGAGVFTDAVAQAQHLHAAGVFGGVAVAAALAASAMRALAGGRDDPWRAGLPMQLTPAGEDAGTEAPRFLVLLSTLERLPLGLKPFGPVRPGLKLLDVAAPPRRLAAALPPLLAGRDRSWFAQAGYLRSNVSEVRLRLASPYVLDGELFPGGDLRVRTGTPLRFAVP